jgi:hypothetical protein
MNVNGINSSTMEQKTSFEKITNIKPGASVDEDIKKATRNIMEKASTTQAHSDNLGTKFNGTA